MTNIKRYTDIDQSKKLAKILPLKSADMYYPYDGIETYSEVKNGLETKTALYCWSLATLYGILPNNKKESTTLSRGVWKIEPVEYLDNWWCEYENESHTKDFAVSADNPIDACYKMILKLHELKML